MPRLVVNFSTGSHVWCDSIHCDYSSDQTQCGFDLWALPGEPLTCLWRRYPGLGVMILEGFVAGFPAQIQHVCWRGPAASHLGSAGSRTQSVALRAAARPVLLGELHTTCVFIPTWLQSRRNVSVHSLVPKHLLKCLENGDVCGQRTANHSST